MNETYLVEILIPNTEDRYFLKEPTIIELGADAVDVEFATEYGTIKDAAAAARLFVPENDWNIVVKYMQPIYQTLPASQIVK